MKTLTKTKLIPILGIGGLLVLANLLICPYIHEVANAEEITIPEDKTGVAGSNASLSISAPTTTDGFGNTTTVGRGVTAYQTRTISLKANKIESYELKISGSPNLTNTKTNANITPTDGNHTGSGLVDNTWGYYYDQTGTLATAPANQNYLPIKLTEDTIDSGKTTSANKYNLAEQKRNLFFAAKFDEDIDEGNYAAEVELSLAITPKSVVGLESLTYMQDLVENPDACGETEYNIGYTLTDVRDGSAYKVARLVDGNCWMAQNLKLKLTTNGLDASNTDITENWRSGMSTRVAPNNSIYINASNNSATGWVNSFTATFSLYNNMSETYGVYYNWGTVMAGKTYNKWPTFTNGVNQSGSSICPKGWTIPLQSDFANTVSEIKKNLTNSASLYYLPFAGGASNGSLVGVGTDGYYWTRTAYGSSSSDYFAVTIHVARTVADTNVANALAVGYPARCISYSN